MAGTLAIIGAGTAGLVAAERLRNAGYSVAVFEKSRGVGGRMATRRRDGLSFDHGAQFVEAKTPDFERILQTWRAAGVAEPWFDQRMVGTPGMASIAKELSKGQDILFSHRVVRLNHNASGWGLEIETEAGPSTHSHRFDTVVLAIPSPQAAELLQTADMDVPELGQSEYDPCLAMMAAFDEPITSLPDRVSPDHPVIAWVARNSSKPDRPTAPETFVIHATAEWSRNHLHRDAQAIGEMLLGEFYKLAGAKPTPTLLMGHRWKYALVKQPFGKPCIWKPSTRLGACGDWCLGPRIEDAFRSGEVMADHIIASDQFG